jgi:hypothetical protein
MLETTETARETAAVTRLLQQCPRRWASAKDIVMCMWVCVCVFMYTQEMSNQQCPYRWTSAKDITVWCGFLFVHIYTEQGIHIIPTFDSLAGTSSKASSSSTCFNTNRQSSKEGFSRATDAQTDPLADSACPTLTSMAAADVCMCIYGYAFVRAHGRVYEF